MKPRQFDAPKQVFLANYPIENLDFFFVVEPAGTIIKMYPLLHADTSERKVLHSYIDPRLKLPFFRFSSWAEEDGYRALDEVYKEDPDETLQEEGYRYYVKHDQHAVDVNKSGSRVVIEPVPKEWLPKIVRDRQAGKGPVGEPFKFPKKSKKKKELDA